MATKGILFASLGRNVAKARSHTTSSSGAVSLYGMYGSPYTRKVQAALRYKQVPFTLHQLMPGNVQGDWDELGFSDIKPKVIPVVKYSEGDAQNDSTFILESLDDRFPARSLVPGDPATAFLSLLLEDVFDEWGTKVMFGMRWQTQEDRDWSGRWLIYDAMMGKGIPLEQCAEMGRQFGSRQVGRMKVVGCDSTELVERSFSSLLAPLERHLAPGNLCLLGPDPTGADFALYGQLSQLVVDRSADRLLRDHYPGCWAWVRRMEDLSGLQEGEGEHQDVGYVREMLQFVAEVYLPFLAANRKALAADEKEVSATLWAATSPLQHSQPVFRYQDKCLTRIQNALAGLSEPASTDVRRILQDTGCLQQLQ